MKLNVLLVLLLSLSLGACKPRPMNIPTVKRKEAATLVSEAQFAVTLRDFARAEPLLEKATKLCPDTGEYWLNLGVTRKRLGNTSGAKAAYLEALGAFRQSAKLEPTHSEPKLQEVYVLALLGRTDDARMALEKAQKKFPDDRDIKIFVEGRQLDRILADPNFKDIAL